MSGHLDSENVFKVRMDALGVSEPITTGLIAASINTMARLAYICTIQPGTSSDDSPFFVAIATALSINPADISVGDRACLRRAWFESSTVAIAEIRSRIESTNEDAPKRMPKPERSARLKEQQNRLAGIKIEGSLEPSYGLLDAVWSMREDDQLRYLTLESCTSRPQEILGIKKESFVKAEASSGVLKQVSRDVNPLADLTTEYRVKLVLTRRALAFDNCGLCEFSVMESVHDYLYSLVMKEALETHHPITVQQILRADKQLWIRLIELTRDGIIASVSGKNPIEVNIPIARLDPLFNALLQPLARSTASYGNTGTERAKPYQEGNQAKQGKGGKGRGGKGRGKGPKGGGKGGKALTSMPDELKGMRMSTNSGGAYCWAANLSSGCPNARFGGYCNKGFHGCMKCGSHLHGVANCDKK